MTKTKRMKRADRAVQVLAKAMTLSRRGGLHKLTQESVARACGITRPAILYYFPSPAKLRNAVIMEAIRTEDADICAQAVAMRDPLAYRVKGTLRADAARFIANA